MNRKSVEHIRKENLRYLVREVFGTQTALAARLKIPWIQQVTISDILRSKRAFHAYEVRGIEAQLKIPAQWMDRDGWIQRGWGLIEQCQRLDEGCMALINDIVRFNPANGLAHSGRG